MHAIEHNIEVVFRCKLCRAEAPSRYAMRAHISGLHLPPYSPGTKLKTPSCQVDDDANTSAIEVSIIIDEPPVTLPNVGNKHQFEKVAAEAEIYNSGSDVLSTESVISEAKPSSLNCRHSMGISNAATGKAVGNRKCLDNNEPSERALNPNELGNIAALVELDDSNKQTTLIAKIGQRSVKSGFNILKCTFCDYTHMNRTAMKSHISTHSTSKTSKCVVCDATFTNKQALDNHWRLHHLGGEHLCDVCGFKAQSKFSLFQHRLRCSTNAFKCQQCEFSTDNIVDLNEHNNARHSNRFSCKRCSDKCTFETKDDMLTHMEEYHPGKSCYFCDKCNFVAKLPNQLRKHSMMHTNERPSKCPMQGCTFSTRNVTYLKYHIAKVHNNDKFTCKQCCYITNTHEQLDLHISLHHMKIYKCKECDFEGKSTTALRRHCLRKHVDSSEMRFKCTECDYCTQFRDCINKHLLTHEICNDKHRCIFCKIVFQSREDLKVHLVESHADRANKVQFCDKCAYSTSRTSNFTVHVSRKHSFIKPFKCSICDYTAKCKVSLKLHTSRKHSASNSVK